MNFRGEVLDGKTGSDSRPAAQNEILQSADRLTDCAAGNICWQSEACGQQGLRRTAFGSILSRLAENGDANRGTRSEISHTVLGLTRSMAYPGPKALSKLIRLLRYLKGTTTIGITYSEDAEDGDKLTAYVDSDFAGDLDDRRSTTGIVLFLVGGPVDWRSMKQTNGGGSLDGGGGIRRNVKGGHPESPLPPPP